MRRRAAASIAALCLVVALVVASVVAGCSSGAASSHAASSGTASSHAAEPANLTIYAASSLGSVLTRVKSVYEAAHSGTTLTISTDSSAALEIKIEQGAPADVFLSADAANPQKLVDAGLVAGSPTRFAANLLTVVVPTGNPARIETPADLARPGVKVIAAGDAVPITKYAAQLVANLAGLPGYPSDFAARYAANVVSRQDNVSAIVAQIALGEGDAGIVYITDARTSTQIQTIAVPEAANVRATYAGVVVLASGRASNGAGPEAAEAAEAFLAWLAGPEGQAILASFGFLPAI